MTPTDPVKTEPTLVEGRPMTLTEEAHGFVVLGLADTDLQGEIERLREVVEFYAEPTNWKPQILGTPIQGQPVTMGYPKAQDAGARARRALNSTGEPT